MKPNISFLDTILRLFLGITFGAICGVMGWGIGVLTVYPIVTALIAWDPVYQKLGRYTTEVSPYLEEGLKASEAVAPMQHRVYKKTA